MTGDGARVIQVPAEALRPIAEVDAVPGMNNLPLRPTHFVGRDRELDRLDAALSTPGQVLVQAVHGLGGIGKSTLVAQWAATRPHSHNPIRWITADSASAVEKGLADLAAVLQPAVAQAFPDQLPERGLQWLATHTGWLLILDNVEDPADIATVLARAGSGRIVITSRRATGWQSATSIVRLDVLDPRESLQLLTDRLTGTAVARDLDGATELCAWLGHLPLALEQAAAYLAQGTLLTPRGYLRLLIDYPADMYRQAAAGADPGRTISRIWRVSLDAITATEPAAADLLRVLAWYAPNTIPSTLWHPLTYPPTAHAAIGALNAYNMITLDPDTNSISIHRLVQTVTHTPDPADPHRTPEQIGHAHTRATTTLREAIPDDVDPATWPTWRLLLPHIGSLLDNNTTDDTLDTAAVLDSTAGFLGTQRTYDVSIGYLRRAITARERIEGPDHPNTLDSRQGLAAHYWYAERYDEALARNTQLLADQERVLGPEHPGNLVTLHNIALAYRSLGHLDESIALFEQTVATRERVLGSDDEQTLISRSNLAQVYLLAQRFDEAIALQEETVANLERVLGPDRLSTLMARSVLADLYSEVRRFDEAIALSERLLTDRTRILGADHPDTLGTRGTLAIMYASARRFDDAITLYQQLLADQERVLGPDHPNTLTVRSNLSAAYRSAGRLDEAITSSEQVLRDSERVLGADHPDTLDRSCYLAVFYRSVRRFDEAITLNKQLLADQERVLGPDHPNTLFSRINLVATYIDAARFDEAITMSEQVLRDSERILGGDHSDTSERRRILAVCYRSARRFDEAIALSQQTLTDQERVLGPDHPRTLFSRFSLAKTSRLAGRVDDALTLSQQALADQERVLGRDHPDTLMARGELALACGAVGRFDEAIALSQLTLADQERVLGPDHPYTRNTRDDLEQLRAQRD